MSREEIEVGGVNHTSEHYGHERKEKWEGSVLGVRRRGVGGQRGFMGAERLDHVINREEGDHGMGGHEEPGGGSLIEGRRLSGDGEGS